MHKYVAVTAVLAVVSLGGCTWVDYTEEGYAVTLAKPSLVENCESVGKATAEVPDNLGPFPRSDKKVREELVTLAKNEAARIGGDTIVELTPPFQGKQQFQVYRCD